MSAVERLAEIEARAAAATEGPWEYWAETEEILARDGGIAEMTWPGRNAPNAAFIAAARVDVPWLVEQVRIRDAAIEAVRAACDEYTDTVGQIFADDIRLVITAALDVTS